ncbi:glycosyltransferase family 9 protein [Mucilaginibacter psychrotolerans]|uniref:Lipopolysaccharide heptosyltransferase family protein n=1 Tax=Mucilaginibacter psychrotolerans TaxID=1524096 RepID=A0A4Y8S852_9SPHI|nr:glycosyltransferase family 9 protein [Mucilaginibacter psychrotolerans]TFF34821.1 lipopolysaccharide heptosyltransferase family protein [Mucilaginibacter psychrotolerans]
MKYLLISRTDAIGDVILTLPMAAYLKELYPQAKVSFLGRAYTGPVIRCNTFVDEFIDYTALLQLTDKEQQAFLRDKHIDAIIHVFPNKHVAALAKQAGIGMRIGTTNRIFHWHTCNKLVRLSRKKSNLHEAQLNLSLLRPLGFTQVPTLAQIISLNNFTPTIALPTRLQNLLAKDKLNLILHPKSHGSAMEWGLDKFKALAEALDADQFNIFITGSDKEQALLAPWIKTLPANVNDVTGQMTLDELIAFIAAADGLIAASTGPLHIAAASGVRAMGLYPGVRPMKAQRWGPLGKQAEYLESAGAGLEYITVDAVAAKISRWI